MAAASPKPLNPCAMPYKAVLKLPHEIYGLQSQQLPTQPPAWAHGMQYYHFVYHQCTPAWEYQTAACYDVYRQPLPPSYSVPYYVHSGDKGFECYNTDTLPQPATLGTYYAQNDYPREIRTEKAEDKAKGTVHNFRVWGRGEKRVRYRSGKRLIAPRQRSQRRGGGPSWGERVWVPKDADEKYSVADGSCVPVCTRDEIILQGRTSLMIKNIPNQFGRDDMMEILDEHCRNENRKAMLSSDPVRSEYDFFYLPMDFRKHANLGYGFVNFTDTVAASRFYKAFHKFQWKAANNKKICEITCAVIQGKDGLSNHFKNSIFPCHTDCYLPVVLLPPRDGLNSSRPVSVGRRASATSSSRKFFINQRSGVGLEG